MILLNSLQNGLRRRAAADEGGFTLIELMVAVTVLMVALVSLAYLVLIGFSDIALARQRQGANGLANQTLEQVRALPFDTLKKGLSNADLTASTTTGNVSFDPNIIKNGTCGAPTVYCYKGEAIPRGANANVVPLVPHQQNLTIGPSSYTIRVYVTYYNNVTTNNTFRVTVEVSWANAQLGGVSNKVTAQTIAFSGSGCLSSATHPFAAPCQPFFYGSGSWDAANVKLNGTIEGLGLDNATLLPAQDSSNMQIEQISAVQGVSQASGVSLKLTSQQPTTSGSDRVTSSADNDPSQPGNDYSTTTVTSSGSTVSANGSSNTVLALNPSTGDPGDTTSTTIAGLANPTAPCPLAGSQVDQQPCGASNIRQAAAMSATLDIQPNGSPLGLINLASVAASTTPANSYTNRDLQSGADGLVRTLASRQIGTVTVAGLPANLAASDLPAGWNGSLVQITGFADSVSAEAGTNTAVPSVTAAGSISYWNGTGYTTRAIAAGPSANLGVGSVHLATLWSGKVLQIDIQGAPNIECGVAWAAGCPATGGTTTSSTGMTCSPACPNTRTAASAQSNSPFVGDIFYKVTYDGSVIAQLTIHVDLGILLAKNSYQVAPSAS